MKRISALFVLLALLVCVAPLSGEAARGSERSRSAPGLSVAESLYFQFIMRFHVGPPPVPSGAGSKSLMMADPNGEHGGGFQCIGEVIVKTGCKVGVDPGCYGTYNETASHGCGSGRSG